MGSWHFSSWTSTRDDGDFAISNDPAELDARRRAWLTRSSRPEVATWPWVWLRQVHGAIVHEVTAENIDDVRGRDGDALVTTEVGIVLAIHTADCAPVVLHAEGDDSPPVLGLAHAGWRGLEAGVLRATADAMRALGAKRIRAHAGPFIHGECYEFGADDLARLQSRFDAPVAGRTDDGAPSLDINRVFAPAAKEAGIERVTALGVEPCTAHNADRWFSHRARRESQRMATVAWRDS